MEFRYWFLLTCLGALWGSAFMFIKIGTPDFGPIALVNSRLIIASFIFLPILLRKKYLPLLKPIWKHALVISISNNVIPFTLFSYASLGANSNILAILNATTAFNTMIIAYLWLDEKVSTKQIFGLALGFLGVLILVNPQSAEATLIASLSCLIASVFYSFSAVFIQKNAAKTNKLVLIGWSLVFSSIIMMPMSYFYLPTKLPSLEATLAVIWLGAISTGFAFLGWVRLIEKIGAVKTSTVAYFLPIFGIIWGNIFLDEIISTTIVVGCLVILVGIFLATSNNSSFKRE
jgi:drug/metabolite transporter (DMT)-like permease